MSEYQYYEFRAVDRPLERKQMDELRALSTRAEITPTSLTNTYHWGSFKGNPKTLLDRYFDAFVYVANWGSHRLMLRIPRGFLDPRSVMPYCDGQALSMTPGSEHFLLDFSSQDEGGEGGEGDEWMASLIAIRDELIRGDLRPLYLGWLASFPEREWNLAADLDEDEDDLEPPVPPGLAQLTAAQRALADFLRVDDDLLEVAATASVGEPAAAPSRSEMARWVAKLPVADKDDYLVRFLAADGDVVLRAELAKRFRESTADRGAMKTPAAKRRMVSRLLTAREHLAEEKRRKKAEQAAQESKRRERERVKARAERLDQLAAREAEAWREVDRWIAAKRPDDYDRAVALLVDLRDLAAQAGRGEEAAKRIHDLRKQHVNKSSFIRRLNEKKLGG